MAQIQTEVLRVNSVPTKNGGTRHVISLKGGVGDDGIQYPAEDYSCFENEVRDQAFAAVGAGPVSADVKITTKPRNDGGVFTNYYLNKVAPLGQLPAQGQPAAGGTPVAAPAQGTPHPAVQAQQQNDSQMNRRSAIHAATEHTTALVQSGAIAPGEAGNTLQRVAQEFVRFIETGSFVDNSPIIPTATTPEEVAAEVPGVNVGVPFDANAPAAA